MNHIIIHCTKDLDPAALHRNLHCNCMPIRAENFAQPSSCQGCPPAPPHTQASCCLQITSGQPRLPRPITVSCFAKQGGRGSKTCSTQLHSPATQVKKTPGAFHCRSRELRSTRVTPYQQDCSTAAVVEVAAAKAPDGKGLCSQVGVLSV